MAPLHWPDPLIIYLGGNNYNWFVANKSLLSPVFKMFLCEQKRSKCKGRKRAVVVFTQKCLSPKAGRRHMDTGQLLTSSSKKRWKGQGRQLRVAWGNYAVRTKSRPHVMLYQTHNLSGHTTPKLKNVSAVFFFSFPNFMNYLQSKDGCTSRQVDALRHRWWLVRPGCGLSCHSQPFLQVLQRLQLSYFHHLTQLR